MKLPLQKIQIVGLKKHYKILMQELHRRGNLEIIQNPELAQTSTAEQKDDWFQVFDLAQIQFAIDFLQNYVPQNRRLDQILSGGKLVISEKDAKTRLENFSKKYHAIIEQIETTESELVQLKNEQAKIAPAEKIVRALGDFASPIRSDFSTKTTKTFLGSVARKSEKKFAAALAAHSHFVAIKRISENKNSTFFQITILTQMSEKVSEILQSFSFQSLSIFPEMSAFDGLTPTQIQRKLDGQKTSFATKIQSLEKSATQLSAHLDDLKIVFDYNTWRKRKNDLQDEIFRSKFTFSFQAWIVAKELDSLKKWLENGFVGEVLLQKIEPQSDEIPPTLVQNNPLVRPFQPIVEMFGTPKNSEFDPTPFVAPFFFVFFGLCLSDVGYGMIMVLIASFFLIFGSFSAAARETIKLFFLCGGAAILGGIFLGGYFGMTPSQLSFLVNPETGLFWGQMLSPTVGSGPITFLLLAIGLGIVHLFFGLLVDFWQKIKNQNLSSALFDTLPWTAFLASALGFGVAHYSGSQTQIWVYLVAISALALVFSQGRDQKKWWLRPVFGIFSIYNLTNWISDALSYCRIMALGLATGVVGFAMNLTAGIFSGMMPHPILGFLIATFVILVGHGLNFSLSLLGAFIHSGRLQFIEFFGKFFEGGGKKFQPFVRKEKYLTFK